MKIPSKGTSREEIIGTMHAYRDAVRDAADRRVAELAAVLYPGPAVRYGRGLEALPAVPGQPGALAARLAELLGEALA